MTIIEVYPFYWSLRSLHNGLEYPNDLLPIVASTLADDPFLSHEIGSFVAAGYRRLPKVDQRKVSHDADGMLPILRFYTRLGQVLYICKLLRQRGLCTPLDDQWAALAGAWLDVLSVGMEGRRAA
jgi:hypothetical protein